MFEKMEDDCGCPRLNEADWDYVKHSWPKRAFLWKKHYLFLHVPVGIGGAMKEAMKSVKEKNYTFKPPYMILGEETGFFTGRILAAIDELPKDDPEVAVWGPCTLYSKFYRGPFKGLKKEIFELIGFVEKKEGKKPAKLYTWVANCPKCWKKDGSPTTVIFAKI